MVLVHTGSTEVVAGGMDKEDDGAVVEEEVALLLEEDTVLTEQDAAQVEEDVAIHVDAADLLRISLEQWYVKIFNSANK